MKRSYQEMIQTEPFTFIVGHERFTVHSGPLKEISALIEKLMTGSRNKTVRIPDVEGYVFLAFCEFAFQGDYTVPNPEAVNKTPNEQATYTSSHPAVSLRHMITAQRSAFISPNSPALLNCDVTEAEPSTSATSSNDRETPESPSTASDSPGACDPDDSGDSDDSSDSDESVAEARQRSSMLESQAVLSTSNVSSTGAQKAWNSFQDKIYESPIPTLQALDTSDPSQSFSRILKLHAHLYAFAVKYKVDGLASAALKRLHHTLLELTLCHQHLNDIMDLFFHAFPKRHIGVQYPGADQNPLRDLVMDYVACIFPDLSPNKRFKIAVSMGGARMIDLVERFSKVYGGKE